MDVRVPVGQLVEGRYRVISHIADGGMGTVYVAHDERLQRDVALKILRPDLARNPAFVDRFRQEARAAARLYHPHVVSVHDQGSDGTFVFLAMELVPGGRTLRDEIHRGNNTVERCLVLFDQALDGLSAAHRAGLIHRDVKPENMLLSRDDIVKVADFGLARAATITGTGAQPGSNPTSDALLGTAPYLSPEQVERGVVDKRSDVYAAGLVLFEMLTGRRAFDGDVPANIAYQHVHGDLPKITSINAELGPLFDELLASVCAKDPAQRPADADELRGALSATRAQLSPEILALRTPAGPEGFGTHIASATETDRTQTVPVNPAQRPAAKEPTDVGRTRHVGASHTQVIPASPAPQEQGVPRRWPLIAAGAVALGALGGGTWAFTAGPLAEKTVPDVRGLSQGTAVEKLRQAGFTVSVKTRNSDAVQANRVITTEPAPGASHRPATPVTLHMSSGPLQLRVPDVTGKSDADARTKLTQTGFATIDVTKRYDVASEGTVISTTPGAGTLTDHRSTVTLVVSQGKRRSSMPDLTRQEQDTASQQLQDLGVTVQTEKRYDPEMPAGSVISTNPSAGRTIETGDTVTLTVSKGPEMVDLPDTVGQSAGDAKRTLEDAGFTVDGVDFLNQLFNDPVVSQSPAGGPGKKAAKGSSVSLSF